jgi:arylformamidase
VINYGLLPATPLRAIVDQIRRACAWLHLNGDRLGFARDRIVCSGHSAGGHLTAMALATAWPRFQPGLPDRILAGGVAISGLYDLAPLLRTEFLGRDLGLGEDEAHELSPLHAKSPPAAPLVLAVGAGESSEFHRQTAQMAASVPASIVGEILEVPGCDHFSVCDALARPGSTLFEATRALLESCRSIDEQRSAVTSGVPAAAEPRSVGHS